MSIYYFDTSALVKRYFPETGTAWVQALTTYTTGHTIVVAEIALVEAAAAFAAKHRAPGGITLQERDSALNLLLHHCTVEYQLIPMLRVILDHAVLLTQAYRLRGYDAVHLAAALTINQRYISAGFAPLTLISADSDMLTAARSEGIAADNPLAHP